MKTAFELLQYSSRSFETYRQIHAGERLCFLGKAFRNVYILGDDVSSDKSLKRAKRRFGGWYQWEIRKQEEREKARMTPQQREEFDKKKMGGNKERLTGMGIGALFGLPGGPLGVIMGATGGFVAADARVHLKNHFNVTR